MRNPHNDPLTSDITGGAAVGATPPERRCILTGEHGARFPGGTSDGEDCLIRLALSPDGVIAPDVLARAPGRGAWLGVSRSALEIAIAKGKLKGALARAFKGPVAFPPDLPDRIEAALTRALTDRLGLAIKAGQLLMGTDRIADAARAGKVRWLAHASDAGADGVGKLAQAWRVGEGTEGSGQRGQILPLDRAALSVALGRDNVVHLALTDEPAARRISGLLQRLLRFTADAESADNTASAEPSGAVANDVSPPDDQDLGDDDLKDVGSR